MAMREIGLIFALMLGAPVWAFAQDVAPETDLAADLDDDVGTETSTESDNPDADEAALESEENLQEESIADVPEDVDDPFDLDAPGFATDQEIPDAPDLPMPSVMPPGPVTGSERNSLIPSMGGGSGLEIVPLAPEEAFVPSVSDNTQPDPDVPMEDAEGKPVPVAETIGPVTDYADRALAKKRLEENLRYYNRKITYFPMLRLMDIETPVETALINNIRSSVETTKMEVRTLPIGGIDLDEFVANLKGALTKGGSFEEWASGRFALKYNDVEIPAETVREILTSNYLYQPTVKMNTIESERKREFRDNDGAKHRYYLKVFNTTVNVDILLYKFDIKKNMLVKVDVPSVTYSQKGRQKVVRMPDGEIIMKYSEDEAERLAKFGAAKSSTLRRRIREAVSKVHDLKLQADLVEIGPLYGYINENETAGIFGNDYFQIMSVNTDGSLSQKGWVKVDRPGKVEDEQEDSRVWSVSYPGRKMQPGDLGFQYPLFGISLRPKMAFHSNGWKGIQKPTTFGTIDPFSSIFSYGLEVAIDFDVISRLNTRDWWITAESTFAPTNTSTNLTKQMYQFYTSLSVGKRFWLGRLGVMPHVGGDMHFFRADGQEETTACANDYEDKLICKYTERLFGGHVGARVEFFIHPRISIASNIRWLFLGKYNRLQRIHFKGANVIERYFEVLGNNSYNPGGLSIDFGPQINF